ncbi:MAG: indolepyruvate oxidoreductase subunit beta [Patescibacteria group bacterium]|nr:indolepyruvate oxidoreductase subunit beta [Patescibacteria group bacterium]
MKREFNIIVAGVGGQGIITLTRILAEAALIENYDVKTSELHGLAQRGGSVETHSRFGQTIFSPLVKRGGADLIISLEIQESLNASSYASSNRTVFLIDEFFKPIFGNKKIFTSQVIQKELEKFSKKVILIPATSITKKEFGSPVLAGIYLLGLATLKKLLPLKQNSILKAIEKVVPKKYLLINKKAFNLAKKYESSYCRSRARNPDASSNQT